MQSRQQGEKANIALAPAAVASIAAVAAAASRLITEPNINTGSWITGNSQHAAEQEKKEGWPKKQPSTPRLLLCTSARRGTGSSNGRQKSGGAGSPRTVGSPREESRLRKDASTSTWKPVRSKVAGSARHRKPVCTDSDNSILWWNTWRISWCSVPESSRGLSRGEEQQISDTQEWNKGWITSDSVGFRGGYVTLYDEFHSPARGETGRTTAHWWNTHREIKYLLACQ